ncbi:glutaredoxin family protein [Candidatus Woesearchaeota archaeon]|jgi:glutaredoxin 3|nr:glutaredoxin family protein [Candidatus Woesearchaeota archaeon]
MAKVTVYGTPTCPWCKRAKEYLESKGVKFDEIDVSKDQEAGHIMMQKSGQMGVPQIDINGKMIVGFDQETLDKEIAKLEK